ATPTVPFGKVVVVIASGATVTTMLNALAAACCGVLESFAFIVKFDVPAAVGVPEITPVAVFSVRPAGNPPIKVHVIGAVPPLVASGWLYAVPTVPLGSEAVLIE